MKFYILDTTGNNAVGAALWWRPNASGYTILLDQAGQYSREELRSCNLRETDKVVSCELAERHARRFVDRTTLLRILREKK